ncbi:MAG: TetR/AcrR family transcriptional regulator [Candidatus Dadabacteria bacterium]|nr:TetR/AcrR family transcriptional regulator [Candidatus Dadabacteria bacterium]
MKRTRELSSREKIIRAASELFFKHGYHQTGINRIIAESGVAKATFYSHFKSKEDLGVEYLRERDRLDTEAVKAMIDGIEDPYKKYMSLVKGLRDHMIETDFRGCAFGNMAVEITEPSHPMRKEIRQHDDRFRSILKEIIRDLRDSSPEYKKINVDETVDAYHLLVEVALTASKNYHDAWPIDRAVKAVEKLVE